MIGLTCSEIKGTKKDGVPTSESSLFEVEDDDDGEGGRGSFVFKQVSVPVHLAQRLGYPYRSTQNNIKESDSLVSNFRFTAEESGKPRRPLRRRRGL